MATILMIEDDEDIRKFLATVIQRMGHAYYEAADGKTGIELARLHQPDIILTDLMLPQPPSDVELLRALRTLLPECPIVVVSGYPSDFRMDECRTLGIRDFLTKPFEVGFVRSVVQRLLEETESA